MKIRLHHSSTFLVLLPLFLVSSSHKASAPSCPLMLLPLKMHRCLIITQPCLFHLVLDQHLPLLSKAQHLTAGVTQQKMQPACLQAMQAYTVVGLAVTLSAPPLPFRVLFRSTARDCPGHPRQKQVSWWHIWLLNWGNI